MQPVLNARVLFISCAGNLLSMKQRFFFFAWLLCTQMSFAQLKGVNTGIKTQVDKIVQDYPNYFASLKGEILPAEPGTVEYRSTIALKGSLENKIIGHPSKKKTWWSFESKLMATEDFEAFKKAYRAYYTELKGESLLPQNGMRYLPEGDYAPPTENLRQISNTFRLKQGNGTYGQMVIDLSGAYINFEWVIFLRIYEKEKDEDMRPSGIEQ